MFYAALKVPFHIVEERRRQLAEYLQHHAYAPLREVCERFHTSEATARRDLAALAAQKQIVRTRGGALTEYNRRFPSFRQREGQHADAKRKIAAAARDLMVRGATCFLDFGTTAYALAEEVRRRPVEDLQIVTNSLPVADLLLTAPGTRVYLLGGELLPRQSRAARRSGAQRRCVFIPSTRHFSAVRRLTRRACGTPRARSSISSRKYSNTPRATSSASTPPNSAAPRPAFLAPWARFDLVVTDAPAKVCKDLGAGKTLLV